MAFEEEFKPTRSLPDEGFEVLNGADEQILDALTVQSTPPRAFHSVFDGT